MRYTEAQGCWREASGMLAAALASDDLMRVHRGLRLDLLVDLSTVHFHLGELLRCEELARSALALARSAQRPEKVVSALNNIGVALLNRGEAAMALPLLTEAAEQARACGERLALGYALLRGATAHKALGAMPDCVALNEEALAVMREIGNHNGVAIVLNNLGDTLRQQGEYGGARELLEQGLQFAETQGLLPRVQNFRLCLGVLLLDSGQYAASRPVLEQALAGTRRGGQYQMELNCLVRLAKLDLLEGDAASCLRRCREVFVRARARGFENIARQALAQHAQLHLTHGDSHYAGQLFALLEADSKLVESARRHARIDREAIEAAHGLGPNASAPLDLDTAAARLMAPHPGIAD
jgi:tetratricopeptide (TPR) repeat protein